MQFDGWAIHKDAAKYAARDTGAVVTGPHPGSVLPPSELTPEARAHREAVHQRHKAERAAGAAGALLAPVLAPKKGGD